LENENLVGVKWTKQAPGQIWNFNQKCAGHGWAKNATSWVATK